MPEAARKLAAAFWPGPLTMILRKAAAACPASVTGGRNTSAFAALAPRRAGAARRVRQGGQRRHRRAVGQQVRPREPHHRAARARRIRAGADGARRRSLRGRHRVDHRRPLAGARRCCCGPGAISREQIAATLGAAPRGRDAAAPRASGALAAHYAPRTPLEIASEGALEERVRGRWRRAGAWRCLRAGRRGLRPPRRGARPRAPAAYAHDLYAGLRALDASGAALILVEAPPPTPRRGSGQRSPRARLGRRRRGRRALAGNIRHATCRSRVAPPNPERTP